MPDSTGAITYRAVLALPGVARVFTAATGARLSYAGIPLALLLTVQGATSSFAAAGTALGLYGVASLTMPVKARLVDRFGQRWALSMLSTLLAAALLTVATLSFAGAHAAVPLVLLTVIAGVTAPPIGPSMRALWSALTPEPAARQRAYSLDSVVEESLYAVGPLAVGLVVAIASPAAVLAGTAALNLAGTIVMATSRISIEHGRAKPRHHEHGWLGPFRSRPFLLLTLAMVGVGLGTGPLEVAVAARTEQAEQAGTAGFLFAIVAIGSVIGGLVWGRLPHRRSLPTQLAALATLAALGLLCTSIATPIPLLAIALAATGAVTAPIYIVAYVSSDNFAPPQAQTEASTWINTSSNLGIGAGTSLAGFLLDRIDPATTLTIAAAPLLLTATITITFLGPLALRRQQPDID